MEGRAGGESSQVPEKVPKIPEESQRPPKGLRTVHPAPGRLPPQAAPPLPSQSASERWLQQPTARLSNRDGCHQRFHNRPICKDTVSGRMDREKF